MPAKFLFLNELVSSSWHLLEQCAYLYLLGSMNDPQRTAVSRKELWQKRKQDSL